MSTSSKAREKTKATLPAFSPRPEDTRPSLCIYKDDLDPEKITALLDLKPTAWQKKGGERPCTTEEGSKSPAATGGWFLSTHSKVKSLNPQTHIEWLVEAIENRHSVIHSLQTDGHKIELWVYWLASNSNASPCLSPETMRKLANLRIPIVFDVYF